MDNNQELIKYKIFRPFLNVVSFTTTKQSINVSHPRYTGDSTNIFIHNRKLLAAKLGIHSNQLIFPRQTHSDNVLYINQQQKREIPETDALITNQPNICICVQTADCVPIFLYDTNLQVIAIVHAGWRGTVKNIVGKTLKKMVIDFSSNPNHIIAAIGPSIGPEIYEVGDEVIQNVKEVFSNPDKILIKKSTGKFHFDLWEANRQILLENHIHPENIEVLKECSFTLNHKYFSARKEGVETGRMVSGIMLKY